MLFIVLTNAAVTLRPTNPCAQSPCGPNSQCRPINDQAVCSCLPEYVGSPPACRPECLSSSECSSTLACVNMKCSDPCRAAPCGTNAVCTTHNHSPICSCRTGFEGNPFTVCNVRPLASPRKIYTLLKIYRPTQFYMKCLAEPSTDINSCQPSPCGPNSACRNANGHSACSCLATFTGSPPNCRPECTINQDCQRSEACINQKCIDPCPGSCGLNAQCVVQNHVPICSCFDHYVGNPFVVCNPAPPACKTNDQFRK